MTDRRKQLIREYKQSARPMGVYTIRNTSNGKCYVAASRNIPARIHRHEMELRNRTERNRQLLAEWIEYGADAFVFETLDLLEPLATPGYDPGADLAELERLWLEKVQPYGERGYN